MDSSQSFSNPSTTRLLRLLRPFTSHLQVFAAILEQDFLTPTPSLTRTITSTPSPFARISKPNRSQKGYGKRGSSVPRANSTSTVSRPHPHPTFTTVDEQISPSSSSTSFLLEQQTTAPPPDLLTNALQQEPLLGFHPKRSYGGIPNNVLFPKATTVINSLKNIFATFETPATSMEKESIRSDVDLLELRRRGRKDRCGSDSLMNLTASVIGRHLESWIKLDLEEEGRSSDAEESFVRPTKGGKDYKVVEKMQEWLEGVPIHSSRVILLNFCLSLVVKLPDHPAKASVLWTCLDLCVKYGHSHGLEILVPPIMQLARHFPPALILCFYQKLHDLNAPTFTHDYFRTHIVSSLTSLEAFSMPELETLCSVYESNRLFQTQIFVQALKWIDDGEYDKAVGYEADVMNLLEKWISRIVKVEESKKDELSRAIRKDLVDYILTLVTPNFIILHQPFCVPLVQLLVIWIHTSDPSALQLIRGSSPNIFQSVLRRCRTKPDLPFHLFYHLQDTKALQQVAQVLRESRCYHVESWFLSYCWSARDDSGWAVSQMEEAERHCVKLELEDACGATQLGSKGNSSVRPGWIWDSVMDCWIRPTPQKRVDRAAAGAQRPKEVSFAGITGLVGTNVAPSSPSAFNTPVRPRNSKHLTRAARTPPHVFVTDSPDPFSNNYNIVSSPLTASCVNTSTAMRMTPVSKASSVDEVSSRVRPIAPGRHSVGSKRAAENESERGSKRMKK